MAEDIAGTLSIPIFQVTGGLDPNPGIRGNFSIPAFTIPCLIRTDNVTGWLGPDQWAGSALPAVRGGILTESGLYVAGFGGGEAVLRLPVITLSASGLVSITGSLSERIPAIRLAATAIQSIIGDLSAQIPAIRLVASGYDNPLGTFAVAIPAIKLSATASADILGVLEKAIGAVKLSASAYWQGTNSATLTIPAVRLTGQARAATIVALCLNTKNFGLTKYTNYAYNSLCVFNGNLVGAKRTGIYELTGTNDDGTDIPWKIRTGKLDMGTSAMRFIWLSGTVSGDIKLIVETSDGTQYEYDAEPVSENEDEIRVKVGKGLRPKYATIELQNEADQTITLDKMQVYGMRGGR